MVRRSLTIEVDHDVAHHAWQSHQLVEGLLYFSFISGGLYQESSNEIEFENKKRMFVEKLSVLVI